MKKFDKTERKYILKHSQIQIPHSTIQATSKTRYFCTTESMPAINGAFISSNNSATQIKLAEHPNSIKFFLPTCYIKHLHIILSIDSHHKNKKELKFNSIPPPTHSLNWSSKITFFEQIFPPKKSRLLLMGISKTRKKRRKC